MNPTFAPRTTGVIERVAWAAAVGIAMKLATLLGLDQETYVPWIATGILSLIGGAYGWWVNRPQKILEAASNVPNPEAHGGKTIVLASPEMAAATTSSPNVISTDDHRVVAR